MNLTEFRTLSWRALPVALAIAALPWQVAQGAVNSYRVMHVTIETPWHIFFFLLIGIFAPFILMVVLIWRQSLRKRRPSSNAATGQSDPPRS